MTEIKEVNLNTIQEFWDAHISYLVNDEIITDEEDVEYFKSNEYRDIICAHMEREVDKHHVIYFVEDGKRIGAAQYCTYLSEDGKCFVLDFWIFKEYRNQGLGHECFNLLEELQLKLGAKYFEINATKDDSIRFWKSLGFVENGVDEYDMPLFVKKYR